MQNTDANKPDYQRAEHEKVLPDLELVSNLLAGTRRMHEKAATYIKKWPDEKLTVWQFRRVRETVFEGLGRTLNAATGMLFAKAPEIEWNGGESLMTEHLDNVDAAGTAFPVFIKRFADSALRDGIGILVVDHPSAPKDAENKPVLVTAANEKELGLRPTWAMYSRAQAINWRDGIVNNRRVLTLLVLAESAQTEDGEFGIATKQRYRVLRLVGNVATWTLYEERGEEGAKTFEVVGAGTFRNRSGQLANFLPVAVAYTGRTDAPMTATIPLLGVANANLSHWQLSTDLRFNSEVVGFSQLVVRGELMKDEKGLPYPLQIGPLTAIQVEKEGGASWEGPAPEGLDQLEKRVQDKLTQMAQQGLSFLQTDTRAAETAEAKKLDASAENSTLATAAQGIEDAANLALEIHGWYLGLAKDDCPTVDISTDYTDTSMAADMLSAYVGAIANAGLPPRLLLQAMQKGGLLSEDVDVEEIEMEMMAAKAAADEAKRIEREEQLEQIRTAA